MFAGEPSSLDHRAVGGRDRLLTVDRVAIEFLLVAAVDLVVGIEFCS